MSMIKRGAKSGTIDTYTKETDEALWCSKCHRIIPSKNSLSSMECPYCKNELTIKK